MTTPMPRSSHQVRNSRIFAAPARWPCAAVSSPSCFAQRRLPSTIMATWLGIAAPSSWRRIRRLVGAVEDPAPCPSRRARSRTERSAPPTHDRLMLPALRTRGCRSGSGPMVGTMQDEHETGTLPHVPFTEEASATATTTAAERKPTWRGWIHVGHFPLAIALGSSCLARPRRRSEGRERGVHADVAAALRHLGDLPPVPVAAEGEAPAEAHRPRQHLPADRRHLHAARGARPAAHAHGDLLWADLGGRALGIAFRVFWINAPRWLYVPLYLVLGCAALGLLPRLLRGERRR